MTDAEAIKSAIEQLNSLNFTMKGNNRLIEIDLRIWTTPSKYAALHKVSKQVVSNWIKRGHLEKLFIPELNLTLVKK